jgi:3'(2'), 5'-bisphosphate nucleotidase
VTRVSDLLPPLDTAFLDELTKIVSRAAAAILAIPRSDLSQRTKPDLSPVTNADHASDAIIAEGLSQLLPGLQIVSEERHEQISPPLGHETFALVDPLDGTKEFIAGRDEFTVNLALIRRGRPVAGLIAAPARGLLYRGAEGWGAQRLRLAPGQGPEASRETISLHTRAAQEDGLVATISRSHLDPATAAFLSRYRVARQIASGSSLKFCLLAEGAADLYPRLGRTSEWDVAAGDAVLSAAGGIVTLVEGKSLVYGAHSSFHIPAFIAWGDPALARSTAS